MKIFSQFGDSSKKNPRKFHPYSLSHTITTSQPTLLRREAKKSQNFPHFRVTFSRFLLTSLFGCYTLYNFEFISCRINRRVSSIVFSFFSSSFYFLPTPHTFFLPFFGMILCNKLFFFFAHYHSHLSISHSCASTAFIMFE